MICRPSGAITNFQLYLVARSIWIFTRPFDGHPACWGARPDPASGRELCPKYDKAVGKLVKDRDVLLAFYDFPAEHWKNITTTNPIESVFATVRNRTRKTKGYLNRKTALAMVFRVMMSAKKKWRKISGPNRLPEIIHGVEFKDGIKQAQIAA